MVDSLESMSFCSLVLIFESAPLLARHICMCGTNNMAGKGIAAKIYRLVPEETGVGRKTK